MSLERDEFTNEFIYQLVIGLSKEDFKEAEKRLEAANAKFLDYLHTFREDLTISDQRMLARATMPNQWNEDEAERKFNLGLNDIDEEGNL